MSRIIRTVLMFLVVCSLAHAGPVPPSDVEAALKSAGTFFAEKVSYGGGYLWTYKADLSDQWGEGQATREQVWVQPPGTPAIGQAFLRMYKATGERYYLGAARAAGDALIRGQLACGGWHYLIDFSDAGSERFHYRRNAGSGDPESADGKNRATFDDNTTQSAIRFLIALDQVEHRKELREAIDAGLGFMLEAQYPNGAWPQWYPLADKGYCHLYTFNDGATNDCIKTMLDAYYAYRDRRYRDSALKGGDFIILSQLKEPQAGWAAQYDKDLKPAWARWFEPPSLDASCTANNIKTLMDLYLETGSRRFLEPIPAAVDWLRRSMFEDGRWYRFYEVGTNEPLFVTADQKVVHEYKNVRKGYSWMGGWGGGAIAKWEHLSKVGRFKVLAEQRAKPTPQAARSSAERMVDRVSDVIDDLDSQGRWTNGDMLRCEDFLADTGVLCSYLELLKLAGD